MRLLWLTLLLASLLDSAAEYLVQVETGDQPLENAVVSAAVPDADLSNLPESGVLKAASGEELFFQKNPFHEILFVIPKVQANTRLSYSVRRGPGRLPARVDAHLENGRISVVDQGRQIFVYQGEESPLPRPDVKPIFKRGGYIHPVYSPSGVLVSDDYPRNHLHHHGIWFPWTKTEFEGRHPDFWNMGDGTGKVEFVKFGERWPGGPVHAGFQAEHRFIDLTSGQPKPALDETWTVTVYHIPGADYFLFDLVSTQKCASAEPLILPKYHYGGLGFRGNWLWNGAKNAEFLTSNGETNRVKGNETRANWCFIGGAVNGAFAGLTIFCHPDNFRAPQPLRLHPTEPYLCFAPSQVGEWQIERSKPYVSRYRFMVSDGRPDQKKIDQIWAAYARPPRASLEKR